ncbi:MAG: calcineurin-like phosphoesterase C-terminal domain-containing protein [Pirellulales bacterium]|nr:calcineurin-like phosphoesterase C-terminal domain-containing protein [Pirellulales bacterium]
MKRREFIQVSAAGAVVTALGGHPCRASGRKNVTIIRGTVSSNGKPLDEVLISDGCRVVRTDGDGRYSLPLGVDSGHFVFVTCPRGYWSDEFYCSTTKAAEQDRVNFSLKQVPQSDRFMFVFAADLSSIGINPREKFGYEKTKNSIREICDLSPIPAFLWIQGDIGIRPDGGKRFLDCLNMATIPTRVGIGNHEIDPRKANPKELYERILGPTYYSFDWGPAHFIVLDGNKPEAGGRGMSRGTVEGSELAWLEADLAAQPKGKPIIVGVHIPIVSTYPARHPNLKETEAPFWQSPNRPKLTSLFTRHGVRMVLQGHMHENERITLGGVEYVASVSLCGSWWRSGNGLERATDGVPRGYRIVTVDGNKVSHRYQSSCESRVDRRGEFMELPDSMSPAKDASFIFNCYDAPQGSTAKARLDDGNWHKMSPVILQDSGVEKPHHWRLVVDTTRLKAGSHAIEACVTWPDGTVVREQHSFQIAVPPQPRKK